MTTRKILVVLILAMMSGCTDRFVELRVIEVREPVEGERYIVMKHRHTLVEEIYTGERFLLRGDWGEPGDEFTTHFRNMNHGHVLKAGG